ncbi:hypothetical protein [Empedobacter tilapiae]|uniref:hypothetical protein n=1 Tax=Empedobacter tilapiae TaxID=2491114 RepID=UPI0028D28C11|nr:hypothetical protein [Empedobacter tilapiae]
MRNKIAFTCFIISLVFCCKTNDNSDEKISILKQEILYDSTNIKNNKFKIKLATSIELKNTSSKDILLKRSDYNDFYMIYKSDTLPLIPNINGSTEEISKNSFLHAEYITYIDKLELNYYNKNLEEEIKNSNIYRYSNNSKVEKNINYFIQSLIALWEGPPNDKSIK